MIITQYNKMRYSITSILTLLFSILTPFSALADPQEIASKTIRQNIEKFEQYKDSDTDKALSYAFAVANDMDSNTTSLEAAHIYDFIAQHLEYSEHQYSKALEYRLHSIQIYEFNNDKQQLARSHAHVARLYLRNIDYHNAYSHGRQALDIATQIGDQLAMREALLTIEQVDYFYNGDVQHAMQYNVQVTDNYSNRDEANQTVRALNNRFNYDLTPDQVVDIVQRTEALCKEYGFNDLLINIYLNVAMQELQFADFEASERYLALAKPLISNFKEEGYYYSASAFYLINKDNFDQAIADITRSIELLGEGDFASKNVHSYFLLQEIYHLEGRYKEAYEALMRFAEIYTQQHNTDNIIELSSLINQLELEQAEQKHRERQKEYEQEQSYNKLMWKIYIAGLALVIALAMLILSRYRLMRKNHRLRTAKAEQELNYKSEIIKIQQLQQFEEKKNIDAITKELNEAVNSTDIREMRSALRKIIRHMQHSDASGGDWAEVEKTLLSNDTFFENLLKEYPTLTKNERKLCTFIHMNLSTKEIAQITHQSSDSINVARSRLRQKFGLTNSNMSLIAFLDRFKTPSE